MCSDVLDQNLGTSWAPPSPPPPITAANVYLISLTSGPPMCKQNEGSEGGKDLDAPFLSLEDTVKWDRA